MTSTNRNESGQDSVIEWRVVIYIDLCCVFICFPSYTQTHTQARTRTASCPAAEGTYTQHGCSIVTEHLAGNCESSVARLDAALPMIPLTKQH